MYLKVRVGKNGIFRDASLRSLVEDGLHTSEGIKAEKGLGSQKQESEGPQKESKDGSAGPQAQRAPCPDQSRTRDPSGQASPRTKSDPIISLLGEEMHIFL